MIDRDRSFNRWFCSKSHRGKGASPECIEYVERKQKKKKKRKGEREREKSDWPLTCKPTLNFPSENDLFVEKFPNKHSQSTCPFSSFYTRVLFRSKEQKHALGFAFLVHFVAPLAAQGGCLHRCTFTSPALEVQRGSHPTFPSEAELERCIQLTSSSGMMNHYTERRRGEVVGSGPAVFTQLSALH